MVNEKLCSKFANSLRRNNPELADRLVEKYSYDSGIHKSFLDILDAVIGYSLKGLSFNQMMSLA